jgi:hypothetical protein
VSYDDDDTLNDPYGRKTFSRLVKGLESEIAVKINNKKRLLTEILSDVSDFKNGESKKDEDINLSIDDDKNK